MLVSTECSKCGGGTGQDHACSCAVEKVEAKQRHRNRFERFILETPFFGYQSGDRAAVDRDGDGYMDACVHSAWMGYVLASSDWRLEP